MITLKGSTVKKFTSAPINGWPSGDQVYSHNLGVVPDYVTILLADTNYMYEYNGMPVDHYQANGGVEYHWAVRTLTSTTVGLYFNPPRDFTSSIWKFVVVSF